MGLSRAGEAPPDLRCVVEGALGRGKARERIKVPVFSIGVWSKVDLHLNGNIVGFQRAGGPKKLLVFGSSNLYAAVADYSSVAFHEKYLLPFYDCYLKGKKTSYLDEPAVRYFVTGADRFETAPTLAAAQRAPTRRSISAKVRPAASPRSMTARSRAAKPAAQGGDDGVRLSPSGLAHGRRRLRTRTAAPIRCGAS